jgi:putative transposase
MIETIRQGLKADGFTVSISQLCRWFEVPRRTVYYKPCTTPQRVDARFATPIKALIEQEPSFGYRTVAHLLGMNKNTVQRVFQLQGWQVKKRPVGFRPRVQSMPSVAAAPNTRWRRISVASGRGVMAGRHSRSSSTVTRANSWAGTSRAAAKRRRRPRHSNMPSSLDSVRSDVSRRRFCCGVTMGSFSRVGATPRSCVAMADSKNLLPRTAPSRTGWSSASFARSKSNACIGTALKRCNTRVACSRIGSSFTTLVVRIKRWR